MDIRRVIPLAVPQGDVGLSLSLLQVQRLVQILVDEMILRTLLATDVAAGWHTDQMYLATRMRYFSSSLISSENCVCYFFADLMEGETLGTDPRVFGVVLAIVEDLAVEILVSVIAGLFVDAVESALGQKQGETIGLLLLLFKLLLGGWSSSRRSALVGTNANCLRIVASVDR